MTIKEKDTDLNHYFLAKSSVFHLLLKPTSLKYIILLKNTPLHISNQANQKCWQLSWRDRNSHFSFVISTMLFELHLPELHALITFSHKRDDPQDRLHGVGTHYPLWWHSRSTPGEREMSRVRGAKHRLHSVGFQPQIWYYDNIFKS